MKVALVSAINPDVKVAMNKDLAGGMGTYSHFGNSIFSKLVSMTKGKKVKIPLISFAYLQGIFRQKGYEVDYFEYDGSKTVGSDYDLILIYGSIVDFEYENKVSKIFKEKNVLAKIGFFGTFPKVRPDLFSSDFVIDGEVESFFLYEFKETEKLDGVIKVEKPVDMNDLPTPDFDGFPINEFSYYPAIVEKPFLTLQASRGCPYSCSYYCPYPTGQGSKYRLRDASKIVSDIETLIRKYKMKAFQFRDPTFGMNKKQVEEFIELMKKKNVNVKFGIETRLDLLDKKILKDLFEVGLRNLNIGVETVNEDVAKLNKRKLIEGNHQEEIIRYCDELGIKISAFYIFGLVDDTVSNIERTINYAIKLNTNVAQFCISIPYPGTKYYDEVKAKGLLTDNNFEKYNTANLVFKHGVLSADEIAKLRERAFRKYYFRMGYLANFLKWRVRELWL
jgi:anaerobic magnesium-protoporphyrin IX monomethyl ester cyclase